MAETEHVRVYLQSLLAGSPPDAGRTSFNGYEVVVQRIEAETTTQGRMARLMQLEKTGKFPLLKELLREDKPRPAPAPRLEIAKANEIPSLMPALPEHLVFDTALCATGCRWLDEAWIPWSMLWSPNSYAHFHEMTGIFLLSALALRRVKMDEGGVRYTNLYLLLSGRSGRYAKTTATELVSYALDSMDMTWFLCDDDATPQKFITDMTQAVAENYEQMDAYEKDQEALRLAFAGQKAWLYDEFGNKISSIAKEGGYMADYRKILRTFDSCPSTYKNATQIRKKEVVYKPYLTLIGSLTPKDVKTHAASDAVMWGDGFLARFLFTCPAKGLPALDIERPLVAKSIPQTITHPLQEWHQQLGVQRATITNEGTDQKPKYSVTLPDPQERICHWTQDAYAAYRVYKRALGVIQDELQHDDLDGNYIRLPEYAIRVAMLFASLDNNGVIAVRHWARAQLFIEHCREGLHNFYAQVNLTESPEKQREDKIYAALQKAGRACIRDISRMTHESSGKVRQHVQELERAGLLCSEKLLAPNGREVTWYWCSEEK